MEERCKKTPVCLNFSGIETANRRAHLSEAVPIVLVDWAGASLQFLSYRVIQPKWTKAATPYIWYGWTNPEILLGGGSHKLIFLFGVS